MDPLFWILAGVVIGCVIGVIIIWRLETQAERRAAAADSRRVEAEVSARLKVFDPRIAVEAVDTRPIPAPPPSPPELPALPQMPPAPPGVIVETPPRSSPQSSRAGAPPIEVSATSLPAVPLRPAPAAAPGLAPGENGTGQANGKAARRVHPEVLPTTPEIARVRAAEVGRERRYLEQAIEEQQTRLEHLLHSTVPDDFEATVAISLLQSELAEQRHHLDELIFLEESYRQMAAPSLEQLAQQYKKAASPNKPRAFGVRRHSLARIESSGQNPPAPPAQATPDQPS